MPKNDRVASGRAGQLWRQTQTHTYLFRGGMSRPANEVSSTASGAGMLTMNDRAGTVTVTFGQFIEQGQLDVGAFHIEMHQTHALWGVNAMLQRCEVVAVE